jgi:hypothetical protein
MLSKGSVLLVILGFALAIVGTLSRGYIRSRLHEFGVTLTGWTNVQGDLRAAEQYFQFARQKRVPMWPLACAVVGLPGGFLLMVAAILRG